MSIKPETSDDNEKYEFTDNHDEHEGTIVWQIRRLVENGHGELGGWLESEYNLASEGSSWVGPSAIVKDEARVQGDAEVYGGSIRGYADVHGGVVESGEINGYAVITGGTITGSARIFGEAKVEGGYIGEKAQVYGGKIQGGSVSGRAEVSGGTMIGGNVGGHAYIDGGVIEGGDVFGYSVVTGGIIRGTAVIKGRAIINSGEYHQGTFDRGIHGEPEEE